MVNKIYPECIMRIQFLETEKMRKIEKCNFFGLSQNTPASREHVQKYSRWILPYFKSIYQAFAKSTLARFMLLNYLEYSNFQKTVCNFIIDIFFVLLFSMKFLSFQMLTLCWNTRMIRLQNVKLKFRLLMLR